MIAAKDPPGVDGADGDEPGRFSRKTGERAPETTSLGEAGSGSVVAVPLASPVAIERASAMFGKIGAMVDMRKTSKVLGASYMPVATKSGRR